MLPSGRGFHEFVVSYTIEFSTKAWGVQSLLIENRRNKPKIENYQIARTLS